MAQLQDILQATNNLPNPDESLKAELIRQHSPNCFHRGGSSGLLYTFSELLSTFSGLPMQLVAAPRAAPSGPARWKRQWILLHLQWTPLHLQWAPLQLPVAEMQEILLVNPPTV